MMTLMVSDDMMQSALTGEYGGSMLRGIGDVGPESSWFLPGDVSSAVAFHRGTFVRAVVFVASK